jgi:L-threonylcarbamoyladenylate synthase
MLMMIKTPEIQRAVAILRAGGVVAFPTETVYGLGADATNPAAIRQIFAVKERPYDHPLIVHLANHDQLSDWALEISPAALLLAKAFWPGPLTLVLKKQPYVLDMVTGQQETVGVRVPSHPIALALLNLFNGGIVAPSANKFTHISPTTAQAVREELGESVDLILDGGACLVGLESTIIDMTQPNPRILRPGMITAEMITAVLGQPILNGLQDLAGIRTPGMHHLHYAPATKTKLIASTDLINYLKTQSLEDLPAVIMLHSSITLPEIKQIHLMKMPSNPSAYAHDLYHTLRLLDNQHFKQIVVECVPQNPEWDAIRDRLIRASGNG